MTVERRERRSQDPLVALHHHLASFRSRRGLDAVVVADDHGLLVAGAGSWPVCEELAAYAPLLGEGDTSARVPRARELAVHGVVLGADTASRTQLWLCASGYDDTSGDADLHAAEAALVRILEAAA